LEFFLYPQGACYSKNKKKESFLYMSSIQQQFERIVANNTEIGSHSYTPEFPQRWR